MVLVTSSRQVFTDEFAMFAQPGACTAMQANFVKLYRTLEVNPFGGTNFQGTASDLVGSRR